MLANVAFRSQEIDKIGQIDLADCERLDEIEQLADAFLSTSNIRTQLEDCDNRNFFAQKR